MQDHYAAGLQVSYGTLSANTSPLQEANLSRKDTGRLVGLLAL
ncbi:MAG TPA: hypothetical protein VE778_05685 [Candidatus Bathyarchaeia archaeon]|nr:hypothetical protein [Candidatus Bathyarchaeia archaeon]